VQIPDRELQVVVDLAKAGDGKSRASGKVNIRFLGLHGMSRSRLRMAAKIPRPAELVVVGRKVNNLPVDLVTQEDDLG
jgi:hypothetical protein